MCGGEGSRLGSAGGTEKPLVPVDGVPTVERVRRALAASSVERIHAVVSPHTPETRAWAESADCEVIEGTGEGYVADLNRALDEVGRPALTCAADLPLLSPEAVDWALDRAEGDSLAVCVPVRLKRELGASADASFERDGRQLAPSGLNVVGDGEDRVVVSWDARLAVNVNRPEDLELAQRLVD
ncbi:NTP transferase domain-containing protein [Halorarum halophilum]|uniref:NTP transferase domain-containing protein n=1 Tax=Halorarum halophilum TaxID=2743090 RepID=A0A7D5KNR5_9EURY|nr:NTP transferase domain-containing protein [Halobaculum halophilum]